MFFLIGGVQPKTITLDTTPRICSSCGLAQARLKRIDHYLSVFFIPLFPVKKGVPVLICERCNTVSSPGQPPEMQGLASRRTRCAACGHPVASDFRYCPGCGKPL